MKPRHLVTLLLLFCFACEKDRDKFFRAETNERFAILKDDITTLPEVPISFYWRPKDGAPLTTTTPVTTCLTTEVKFEHPYIIANGFKFHVYYWTGTENQIRGDIPKIVSTRIAFDKEK